MSDHPYKYMIQIDTSHGHNINSESLQKYDLEQIRTEASMAAEIFGLPVIIYSVPALGGRWQVLEHVDPPTKEKVE